MKNEKIAGENQVSNIWTIHVVAFLYLLTAINIVQKMTEKKEEAKKKKATTKKETKFHEEPIPPNHDTVDNKRSHAVIPSHTVCIHHFVQWCKTQAPNHY